MGCGNQSDDRFVSQKLAVVSHGHISRVPNWVLYMALFRHRVTSIICGIGDYWGRLGYNLGEVLLLPFKVPASGIGLLKMFQPFEKNWTPTFATWPHVDYVPSTEKMCLSKILEHLAFASLAVASALSNKECRYLSAPQCSLQIFFSVITKSTWRNSRSKCGVHVFEIKEKAFYQK